MCIKIVLLPEVPEMVTDTAFVISSTETLPSFSMLRYGNGYCSTPSFCSNAGLYGFTGGGIV